MKNEVQALLFASGSYMTADQIAEVLETTKSKVSKALQELKEGHEKSDGALAIQEANGRWKMTVKKEYLPVVKNIVADTELETPVLETLAVIAWKRPILQSEVVGIRGDHAYQHIKELMELGFLTREKHGRTYKLKLAEKFFEYFDVEGEGEIRELFRDAKKPEPKLKDKLGELDVIDLEKEKKEGLKKGKLGQLEVVDEPDPYGQRKVEQEELDELDAEIDKISRRTDDHIKDMEQYTDSAEQKEEE